jgi:mRNA interferase MazF
VRDGFALELDPSAFQKGGLRLPSNVRPNRLFTAERSIIVSHAGQLRREKMVEVTEAIVAILRS